SLDIDNGPGGSATSVTVTDVNALDDIRIVANQIQIVKRDEGDVLDASGVLSKDKGTDLVAGGNIFFSTNAVAIGTGPNPRAADADGVVSGGINLLVERKSDAVTTQDLMGPGGEILDLMPEGPSATNTSAFVAGADPFIWSQLYPPPPAYRRVTLSDDQLLFDELMKFLTNKSWQPEGFEVESDVAPYLNEIVNRYWVRFMAPVSDLSEDQAHIDPSIKGLLFKPQREGKRNR
ncbi:MAG: hypothetical protein ACYTG7_24505, partial [Planctomycetota bacterium]